jgi:probable DNA repair protein
MQKTGFLFPSGTSAEAIALFRRLAQETRLPLAKTDARIQVTGPVASAGMRFTHLWCMQMTEQHWPGEGQANPWLPLDLQREAGFPGVDPTVALHKARQMLQQLLASTHSELVFSYAIQADEAPVRASALLPTDLDVRVPELSMPALHPAISLFTCEQELLLDVAALPLPLQLQHSGSGGVLADQAACPFRAFAKHRLKVRELPELTYGLSASIVGECIHSAMQNFWKVIQNSERLHLLADTELAEHINAAVSSALLTVSRRFPHTMMPRYQELEQERLCRLLTDWMQAERLRGSFSVLASEEQLTWRFANLTLNLRIDRIDRNEDGSLTVVDYKTGQKATTRWQQERPEQPQLLLYQDALDAQNRRGPANALLYAYVNLKERTYDGVGADDLAFPNIAFSNHKSVSLLSWDSLKQHWQTSLQQLAQEYLDGRLVVAPLSRTTCNYCHLDSFCRIRDRRALP